jgi:hypothetical protein
MDKKKITRRVAIGTVIGGLVAAPFVVRRFRSKHDVPESAGLKAWKRCFKETTLEPAPIPVLQEKDFPLSFRLKEDEKMSMWMVFASFSDKRNQNQISANTLPLWFTEQNAKLSSVPIPQVGNQIGLSVSDSVRYYWSILHTEPEVQETPPFALVVDKQSLQKIVLADQKVYNMPQFDLPPSVLEFYGTVLFGLPDIDGCKKGFRWVSKEIYEYPVSCEVVNVVNINKREVAEVDVECKPSGFAKHALLNILPNDPKYKPFIEQYSKLEFQYSHSGKLFIDIQTGLVLYHRYSNTIESRIAKSDDVTVISSFCAGKLLIES